jgi:hypothetical protein
MNAPAPQKMKIASGGRDSAQAKLSELTQLLLPFAIRGLATLGVADALADGPQPVETIAKTVGADTDALYRTLRYTAGKGVFVEFPGRVFALTSLANWLRSDVPGSMRPRLMIDDGLVNRLEVFTEVVHTLRTGESAYQKVRGGNPFDASAADRGTAARFHRQLSPGTQTWPDALVEAVGFAADTKIVDVGGGTGSVLGTILSRTPALTGVLFDQPPVIEEAAAVLDSLGVADRCDTVGGDMFDEVPAGGDTYLLSFVLHDWPDEQAAAVLANVRAAMDDDARLLIVESLISDDEEQAAQAVQQDFMMMLHGVGRERTGTEHSDLLDQVGLQLESITPLGPGLSVLEARRAPNPEGN